MSALAAYRGLLSNRPLGRLLFGEFVSSIGDWLYLVALLILVYRETEDPVVLGIVGAARVLPYVVLSVPAGIVADRYDRRLVLLVTDVIRGLIMLAMAWLVATDAPIIGIIALAIVATCFSSFFSPTIGAYLPSLVRDERELGPANSAWATLDNMAYIVGPAVAGILVATADLVPAFVLNAASFAVVAVVLWGLPPSDPRAAARAAEEAAQAADAASESDVAGKGMAPVAPPTVPTAESALAVDEPPLPTVRSILRPVAGLTVLDVVGGFVGGGLGVLTVIIANEQLAGGDEATGYLNAAMGIGGLIGAIGSGVLVLRRDLGPALIAGSVGLALGLAGLGASGALLVAMVAMAVAIAGSLVSEVVSTTVFQRVVPDAIRGRAFGVTMTVSTLAYAAGNLVMPVLADSLGMFLVLAVGGGAVVVASIVAVLVVGPGMRRAPDAGADVLLRVSALPLFTGVPAAALEATVSRLRPLEVAAGTVVVREGEPALRFYLIERGEFAVDQADPVSGERRRLRVMGADEVFGEIGLLARGPRTATVTAVADGRLLALEAADFLELVSAGPGLSSRLLGLRRGSLVPSVGAAGGEDRALSAG